MQFDWTKFWETILGPFLAAILLFLFGGCQALNKTPPVETTVSTIVDKVVVPLIEKGASQGLLRSTTQAGAQAINPTYVLTFEGKWVTGVEGTVTVGVEGLAGTITTYNEAQSTSKESDNATEK